jgi:hypothetical protein
MTTEIPLTELPCWQCARGEEARHWLRQTGELAQGNDRHAAGCR